MVVTFDHKAFTNINHPRPLHAISVQGFPLKT
uniref:Uncharacterized protein n=1 Tax=virus sp. ctQiC1 TaxID=2825817 RepID=A0A8S5RMW4_9VIRU|nr:MAG TPA: hypothetical protein [virus sp. ctQiC1]